MFGDNDTDESKCSAQLDDLDKQAHSVLDALERGHARYEKAVDHLSALQHELKGQAADRVEQAADAGPATRLYFDPEVHEGRMKHLKAARRTLGGMQDHIGSVLKRMAKDAEEQKATEAALLEEAAEPAEGHWRTHWEKAQTHVTNMRSRVDSAIEREQKLAAQAEAAQTLPQAIEHASAETSRSKAHVKDLQKEYGRVQDAIAMLKEKCAGVKFTTGLRSQMIEHLENLVEAVAVSNTAHQEFMRRVDEMMTDMERREQATAEAAKAAEAVFATGATGGATGVAGLAAEESEVEDPEVAAIRNLERRLASKAEAITTQRDANRERLTAHLDALNSGRLQRKADDVNERSEDAARVRAAARAAALAKAHAAADAAGNRAEVAAKAERAKEDAAMASEEDKIRHAVENAWRGAHSEASTSASGAEDDVHGPAADTMEVHGFPGYTGLTGVAGITAASGATGPERPLQFGGFDELVGADEHAREVHAALQHANQQFYNLQDRRKEELAKVEEDVAALEANAASAREALRTAEAQNRKAQERKEAVESELDSAEATLRSDEESLSAMGDSAGAARVDLEVRVQDHQERVRSLQKEVHDAEERGTLAEDEAESARAAEAKRISKLLEGKREARDLEEKVEHAALEHAGAMASSMDALRAERDHVVERADTELRNLEEGFDAARELASDKRTAARDAIDFAMEKLQSVEEVHQKLEKEEKYQAETEALKGKMDREFEALTASVLAKANKTLSAAVARKEAAEAVIAEAEDAIAKATPLKENADAQIAAAHSRDNFNHTLAASDEHYLKVAEEERDTQQAALDRANARLEDATKKRNTEIAIIDKQEQVLGFADWLRRRHAAQEAGRSPSAAGPAPMEEAPKELMEGSDLGSFTPYLADAFGKEAVGRPDIETYGEVMDRVFRERATVEKLEHEREVREAAAKEAEQNSERLGQEAHRQEEVVHVDSIAVDRAKARIQEMQLADQQASQAAETANDTLQRVRKDAEAAERVAEQGVQDAEESAEASVRSVEELSHEYEGANAHLTALRLELAEVEADYKFSKRMGDVHKAAELEGQKKDLQSRVSRRQNKVETLAARLDESEERSHAMVSTLEEKATAEREERESAVLRSAHAVGSSSQSGASGHVESRVTRLAEEELQRMHATLEELESAFKRSDVAARRAGATANRAVVELRIPQMNLGKAQRDLEMARADQRAASAGGMHLEAEEASREVKTATNAYHRAMALFNEAKTNARVLVREQARAEVHRDVVKAYLDDMRRWAREMVGIEKVVAHGPSKAAEAVSEEVAATGATGSSGSEEEEQEEEDPGLDLEDKMLRELREDVDVSAYKQTKDAESVQAAFDKENSKHEQVMEANAEHYRKYMAEKAQLEREAAKDVAAYTAQSRERQAAVRRTLRRANHVVRDTLARFETAAASLRTAEDRANNFRAYAADVQRSMAEAQPDLLSHSGATDAVPQPYSFTGATGASDSAQEAVQSILDLPNADKVFDGVETSQARSLEDAMTLFRLYEASDVSLQARADALEVQALFRRETSDLYEVELDLAKQSSARVSAAEKEAEQALVALRKTRVSEAVALQRADLKHAAAENATQVVHLRQVTVEEAQRMVEDGAVSRNDLAVKAESARDASESSLSQQRTAVEAVRSRVKSLNEEANAAASNAEVARKAHREAKERATEARAVADRAEQRLREAQEVARKHGASTDGSGNASPASGDSAVTERVQTQYREAVRAVHVAEEEVQSRQQLAQEAQDAERKAADTAQRAAVLAHHLADRADAAHKTAVEGRKEANEAARKAFETWNAVADKRSQEATEAEERLRVARETEAEAVKQENSTLVEAKAAATEARKAAESAHARLTALVQRQKAEETALENKAAKAIAAARVARKQADEADAAAVRAQETEKSVRAREKRVQEGGKAPMTKCGVSIRDAGTCPAWRRLQEARETSRQATQQLEAMQEEAIGDADGADAAPEVQAAIEAKKAAEERAEELNKEVEREREQLKDLYSQQRDTLAVHATSQEEVAERDAEHERLSGEVEDAEASVQQAFEEARSARWAARNASAEVTDLIMKTGGHRDDLAKAEEQAREAAKEEHAAHEALQAARKAAQKQADKAEEASRAWINVVHLKELVSREEAAIQSQEEADRMAHELEHQADLKADEARVDARNATTLVQRDSNERREFAAELERNQSGIVRSRNAAQVDARIAESKRMQADAELAVSLASWHEADAKMRDTVSKARFVASLAAKWDSAEHTEQLPWVTGLTGGAATGPAADLVATFREGMGADEAVEDAAATGAAFASFGQEGRAHDLEERAFEARNEARQAAEDAVEAQRRLEHSKVLTVRRARDVTRAEHKVQRRVAAERKAEKREQVELGARRRAAQLVRQAKDEAKVAREKADRITETSLEMNRRMVAVQRQATNARIAARRAEVELEAGEESLRVLEEHASEAQHAARQLRSASNGRDARALHLRITQQALATAQERKAAAHEAAVAAAQAAKDAQAELVAASEHAKAATQNADEVNAAAKHTWSDMLRESVTRADASLQTRLMALQTAQQSSKRAEARLRHAEAEAVDVLREQAQRKTDAANLRVERQNMVVAKLSTQEGAARMESEQASRTVDERRNSLARANAELRHRQKQLTTAQAALVTARARAEETGDYLADVAADEAEQEVSRKKEAVDTAKTHMSVIESSLKHISEKRADADQRAEMAAVSLKDANAKLAQLSTAALVARNNQERVAAVAVDKVRADVEKLERRLAGERRKRPAATGGAGEGSGVEVVDAALLEMGESPTETPTVEEAMEAARVEVARMDPSATGATGVAGPADDALDEAEDEEAESTELTAYEVALAHVVGAREEVSKAAAQERAALLEKAEAEEVAYRLHAVRELEELMRTALQTQHHASRIMHHAHEVAGRALSARSRSEHAQELEKHLAALADLALRARTQSQEAEHAHAMYQKVDSRRAEHAETLEKAEASLDSVSKGVARVHASLEHAKMVLAETEDTIGSSGEAFARAQNATREAANAMTAAEEEHRAASAAMAAQRKHVKELATRFTAAAARVRRANEQRSSASDAATEARVARDDASREAHRAIAAVQDKCRFGSEVMDAKEIAHYLVQNELSEYDRWMLKHTPEKLKEKVQKRVRLLAGPCKEANATALAAVKKTKEAKRNLARAEEVVAQTKGHQEAAQREMETVRAELKKADADTVWAPLRRRHEVASTEVKEAAARREESAAAFADLGKKQQKAHAELERRRAVVERLEGVLSNMKQARERAVRSVRDARANEEAARKAAEKLRTSEEENREGLRDSLSQLNERGFDGVADATGVDGIVAKLSAAYSRHSRKAASARTRAEEAGEAARAAEERLTSDVDEAQEERTRTAGEVWSHKRDRVDHLKAEAAKVQAAAEHASARAQRDGAPEEVSAMAKEAMEFAAQVVAESQEAERDMEAEEERRHALHRATRSLHNSFNREVEHHRRTELIGRRMDTREAQARAVAEVHTKAVGAETARSAEERERRDAEGEAARARDAAESADASREATEEAAREDGDAQVQAAVRAQQAKDEARLNAMEAKLERAEAALAAARRSSEGHAGTSSAPSATGATGTAFQARERDIAEVREKTEALGGAKQEEKEGPTGEMRFARAEAGAQAQALATAADAARDVYQARAEERMAKENAAWAASSSLRSTKQAAQRQTATAADVLRRAQAGFRSAVASLAGALGVTKQQDKVFAVGSAYSFFEAEAACGAYGAHLCAKTELLAAFVDGVDMKCAWTQEGDALYALNQQGAQRGVAICQHTSADDALTRASAACCQ